MRHHEERSMWQCGTEQQEECYEKFPEQGATEFFYVNASTEDDEEFHNVPVHPALNFIEVIPVM